MKSFRKRASGQWFDVNARPVPIRAQALLGGTLVVASICIADAAFRISQDRYKTSITAISQLLCLLLAGLVNWSSNWRDELEFHDGAHMAAVGISAMATQVTFTTGLEWAGAALLTATHLLLASRNAKGLYIAFRKQLVAQGPAIEAGVGLACAAGILAQLTYRSIAHGYSGFTAAAMVCSHVAAALSAFAAWANRFAERFPQVNKDEMFRAVCALTVAEVVRAVGMAVPSAQVLASSLGTALFGVGLAAAGVASHRRTYLRKKDLTSAF